MYFGQSFISWVHNWDDILDACALQKLLKICCFLLQSIGGALLLPRLAWTFCLASAAVRLRCKPLSQNGSTGRCSDLPSRLALRILSLEWCSESVTYGNTFFLHLSEFFTNILSVLKWRYITVSTFGHYEALFTINLTLLLIKSYYY